MESTGAFGPDAAALLRELEARHGRRTGLDELASDWTCSRWYSFHSQRISIAVHMAAAQEILDTAQRVAAALLHSDG